MKRFMRDTYINDPFFIKKKAYQNNYFDTLETKNKLLDKADNNTIDI